MIPLKAIFVISVLISGLIFSPSYSFAQSNQDDNPLSWLFEAFMKLFSFDDEPSEPVIEFEDAVGVQSSSSTPVANAGGNQTVMQFEKVTLDGSSSTDPDGDTISFHWNQTEGPPVALSDDTAVNPMFNATLHGVLKFILTVVDTSNLTDTASVTISVIEKDDENSPPVANAGGNQTVMQFDKVTLDGSSSTDPDGDTISFHWNQTEGPPVALSNATAVSPMFNATLHGVLKFMLTVVDTSNETDVADVYITVQKKTDESDNGNPDNGNPDNGNPDNGNPDNGNPDNDKDQNKVTMCHIPPGNPDNAHTITVGEPAVLTHMTKHGDTIGPCSNSTQNEKSNSGKGNNDDENKPDNSGKGNSDKEKNEKLNSGKGNKDKDDDHENSKDNSGKGNSGVDNSGKENKNNKKDDNEKSNSGKGNKDDNGNKSNSKLKNNNDDEAKVEDNEHEDEDDDEDEDENEHEDDDEDEDD